MQKLRSFVEDNQLAEVADYLVNEMHRLADAGAAFRLIAAATPHLVFDEVR